MVTRRCGEVWRYMKHLHLTSKILLHQRTNVLMENNVDMIRLMAFASYANMDRFEQSLLKRAFQVRQKVMVRLQDAAFEYTIHRVRHNVQLSCDR